MRRKRVYLESSVISYLTARPSNDILKLAKQRLTKDWWRTRNQYDLFVSQTVLDEIIRGDPVAAERRVQAIVGIERLAKTPVIDDLVDVLIDSEVILPKFREDAYHIAIAAFHSMDYLLTWNQKHIANRQMQRRIETILQSFQLPPSLILNPEQLWEIEEHETT